MSPVAQAERGDTPRFSFAHGADLLAVSVLIGVAAIAALTFRDYGLGWDDFTHAQYGDLLLKLYGSRFAERRTFGFVNLYMYGGGFDMLAALAAKILPFDLFATRRLVGAAVGLVGLAATWRIGRRLGGPTAGLIALVLLATCPLYYGHMCMNPKDAPYAAAMALLLLALARPGGLSAADAGHGRAVRHRAGVDHRLAHHRRHGGTLCRRRGRLHRRGGGAHAGRARGCGAARPFRRDAAAGCRDRLPDHGAGVALGRGRAAQSDPIARIFFRVLRK